MSHHVQFTPLPLISENRKFLATSFELREPWGQAVFQRNYILVPFALSVLLRPRFLLFFFFFFFRVNSNLTWVHCSRTVQHCSYTVLHCSCTVHVLKILKIGPTILFTHLKIILLQCFQFCNFNVWHDVQSESFKCTFIASYLTS